MSKRARVDEDSGKVGGPKSRTCGSRRGIGPHGRRAGDGADRHSVLTAPPNHVDRIVQCLLGTRGGASGRTYVLGGGRCPKDTLGG